MKIKSLFLALLIAALGGSLCAQTPNGAYSSPASGSGSSSSGAVGSATSPASPAMGFYLTNACPSSNTGQCFFTPANTQEQNNCSWSAVATTVTCTLTLNALNATVAANVVTYNQVTTGSSGGRDTFGLWAVGDSVTVSGFTGADTFFNQTCTLTSVTALNITCALVHANASSTTNGIVTDVTGGPFVAGDVGKQAQGWSTCVADLFSSSYGSPIITGTTVVTIAGFTNKSNVTLSQNPANAVASAGCFIWGTPDDTGAAASDAALSVAPQCPKLFLGAAYYLWSNPHYFTQPYGCAQLGTLAASGHGNVTLPVGFEIEGRGTGPTTIFLASSFPNGDSCQHASGPPADGVKGCFAIPMMGKWTDFQITGGGNMAGAGFSGGPDLIAMQVATLQNFLCTNTGGYSSVGAGIRFGFLSQMYQVNNAGCGQQGIAQSSTPSSGSVGYRVIVENSGTTALTLNPSGSVSPSFVCYWCVMSGATTMTNKNIIDNNGGILRLYGGRVIPANFFPTTNSGINQYKCSGANGSLYADGTTFEGDQGVSNGGIFVAAAGCTVSLVNSAFNGTSYAYADTAGGTLILDSATTYTSPFSNGPVVGKIIADGHSVMGICTGVGTAASTLALRISGTSTTGTGIPSTCTSTTLDAGVAMPQGRVVSALIVTATAAGTNASSGVVTVLKNGVATTLTCTIGTSTSCNDFTHTVAFAASDLLSMQFTTQAADTLAGVKAKVMWQ